MITCIKELNQPRYLSVGGAFEAYSKPLVTMTYETLKDHPLIDATTIGLKGSPTNILTSFTPPQKGAGMMLEGAGKDHRQAGRHPGRQAHHLRKEIRKWLLIVLTSAPSKRMGFLWQRQGKMMPTTFELISEGGSWLTSWA